MRRVGFLVNPIAGMGGRVGLKGTDGVVEEALAMGARPVAPDRAVQALKTFRRQPVSNEVRWVACSEPMGEAELRASGFADSAIEVVYRPQSKTTATDTKRAVEAFLASGIELILFCGGDGTARDVFDVVDARAPILGIPAGVKMHSAVFAVNPEAVAETLSRFLRGELSTGDAEVIDLDEEQYRRGEWALRLYGVATTPQEPNLVQTGKLMVEEVADDAIREEVAEYIGELMEENPDTLFIFGPGGTTHYICNRLGIDSTLLGIDAVRARRLVGKDLNEEGLLRLLEAHPRAKLVLSPIGSQGFILGRGNLQLSPSVIRRIGPHNLMVVATPSKLRATPVLRVDTGDRKLDAYFNDRGHLLVVVGYRTMKLHPIRGIQS